MMKIQVSVTPNEAKLLIAKAIISMPMVRRALDNGKVLLKGGTTVAAIAELMTGTKMRIAGRITQRGARTSRQAAGFHALLIEGGQAKGLNVESDAALGETVAGMRKDDVLIMGANAIDVNRRTAMMIARPFTALINYFMPALMLKGINTIIAVGWEKLIPCPMEQAVDASGTEIIDVAMGMAVGLIPLRGTTVTETDAVTLLTGAKTMVIGAGGIMGGEGSTTFVVEGDLPQVKEAWEIITSVKGAAVCGSPETLVECEPKCPKCSQYSTLGNTRVLIHSACAYRDPNLPKKAFARAEAEVRTHT
jgi:hypothetical protein